MLAKFICFCSLLSLFLQSSATEIHKENRICETFVTGNGFNCREFVVRTEDLFLLSLQRIWKSRSSNVSSISNRSNPVFLYHGIMQGGDVWLLNEAKESLGFILAEAGYEVWVGNTRSSSFSSGHLLYSPSHKEFWDWDFDDIVAYDLPSMLSFIAKFTKKRILYVGFSQGAMAGFAAFTNNKVSRLVEKAVMLSPIAYLANLRSIVTRLAASFFLDQLDLALGVNRFTLADEIVNQILDLACLATNSDCYNNLLALVEGPSCCINQSRVAYYKNYELQSTSMLNIIQLAQLVRSGRFCKYDHGILGNLINYWTIFPPSYELRKLPKRLTFLLAHGGNDYLADVNDVRRLRTEIPGSVDLLFVPKYSHGDFVLGMYARVDVYPRVLSFLGSTKSK